MRTRRAAENGCTGIAIFFLYWEHVDNGFTSALGSEHFGETPKIDEISCFDAKNEPFPWSIGIPVLSHGQRF